MGREKRANFLVIILGQNDLKQLLGGQKENKASSRPTKQNFKERMHIGIFEICVYIQRKKWNYGLGVRIVTVN